MRLPSIPSRKEAKGFSELYILPPTYAETWWAVYSEFEDYETAFERVCDLDRLYPEILRRKFLLPKDISANMERFDLSTLLKNIELGGDAGTLEQGEKSNTTEYLERRFNQVSPKTTLESENRYVDCKSLSVLTVTFLRKAGIPSRLTTLSSHIHAGVGHHMVVEEYQNGKWRHLDPIRSLEGKLHYGKPLVHEQSYEETYLKVLSAFS